MARREGPGAGAAAVLAVALLAPRAGTAGDDAHEMRVATRDPTLLSALHAAFAPRGFHVFPTERPLRAPGDDPGATDRDVAVVWLCSAGAAPGDAALCVRPRQGPLVVRRIDVKTPLSAEDAAALALTVEVALMPDATPRAPAGALVGAASPLPVRPTEEPRPSDDGLRALTLELGAGARGAPDGLAPRASVSAVCAPRLLGRHLGLGAGIAGGPAYAVPQPSGRGQGPPPPAGSERDLTLRLFARAQTRLGPTWLQLDLGSGAHLVTRGFGDSDRPSEERVHLSADGFLGAVIPVGRYFVGARAGASYLLSGTLAPTNPSGATFSTEALAAVGVGWL